METTTTKKIDYYLSAEEIDILSEAHSIIAQLVAAHGDMINDCNFNVEGQTMTLRGEDVDTCNWILNDLSLMLEDSNHIIRTKSLKDFEEYYGFNTDRAAD